jgi:hypothetical protein
MRQEHKIHRMMERTIAATLDRTWHEESKKLADELLDEDE